MKCTLKISFTDALSAKYSFECLVETLILAKEFATERVAGVMRLQHCCEILRIAAIARN